MFLNSMLPQIIMQYPMGQPAQHPPQQQRPASLPTGNVQEIITRKEPVDETTRRWQLSGFDIIEEVRNRLEGKQYDPETRKWTQIKGKEPYMNAWGIGEISCWLSAYINKNNLLSYFEPREINALMIDFEKALTRKFEYDWSKMGLMKQDVDMAFLLVANGVWSAMNRARYGGEKQFIEGTEQRRIVTSEGAGQGDRRNFWEKLPGFGR